MSDFNRITNFLTGRVITDNKTRESLGINLGFQDDDNRQALDRMYLWEDFDTLFTQIQKGVADLRVAPKVIVHGRKERPFMRIFMPATRKDEQDCWYCLYLPEAEKLMEKLTQLSSSKPPPPLTKEEEEILNQIAGGTERGYAS